MTFFLHLIILFLNVELSEKVERNNSVDIDNNGEEHYGEHELESEME